MSDVIYEKRRCDELDRLEMVRNEVDKILLIMVDDFERRCAYLHLYGVSQACSMVAIKRGLDSEISAISGMLHDIYTYRTGISKFHAHNSAEEVRPVLRDMNAFSLEEQNNILSAIFHHSDKGHVHDDYDGWKYDYKTGEVRVIPYS
jgi:uncharacterized protein